VAGSPGGQAGKFSWLRGDRNFDGKVTVGWTIADQGRCFKMDISLGAKGAR